MIVPQAQEQEDDLWTGVTLPVTVARYRRDADEDADAGESTSASYGEKGDSTLLLIENEDDSTFSVVLAQNIDRDESIHAVLIDSTEQQWTDETIGRYFPELSQYKRRLTVMYKCGGDKYEGNRMLHDMRSIADELDDFAAYVVRHLVDTVMWDTFEVKPYLEKNYKNNQEAADLAIMDKLSEFYSELVDSWGRDLRIVDVGGGPNLYPLIAAAPFASCIEEVEYSQPNCDYLRQQINGEFDSETWEAWLEHASEHLEENHLSDETEPEQLQALLSNKLSVRRGSLYELPAVTRAEHRRQGHEAEEDLADVVSMHFVAESITDDASTFRSGLIAAVESTRPGGWLVASFVAENTTNAVRYGDHFHPVINVSAADIENILDEFCDVVIVEQMDGEIQRDSESHGGGMLFVKARRAG
jgi:hypothetical protein